MDTAEHVEGLILGTGSSGGSSDIKSLNEALRALLSSADKGESVKPIEDAPEGVDYSKTLSLWIEIADHSHTGQASEPPTSSVKTSSVTTRLYSHLHSVSEGEEGLYSSILSDVRRCLETKKVSDEHISSTLAETLGFDQLDLVTDLVREKEQVCRELSVEVSRSQRLVF